MALPAALAVDPRDDRHARRWREIIAAQNLTVEGRWRTLANGRVEQMRVNGAESLGAGILGTGFPYSRGDGTDDNRAEHNRLLPLCRDIRRMGSAAIDLAHVAAGIFSAFWEVTLNPWDVGAGLLLVHEAGGIVTDYAGNPYAFGADGLIASIACRPQHHPAINAIAAAFPTLPILIHHLGHPGVGNAENLTLVLGSAQYPNIHVKVSGFYYSTAGPQWDFPHRDTNDAVVRPLYEAYGGDRLCWGSDYPVCRRNITYRQALEAFRTHCDCVAEEDRAKILGGNLAGLLGIG